MINRFREVTVLAAAIGLALGGPAAASEVSDRILDFTRNGEIRQALELARGHISEMEGDPDFDFAYGLAVLESGNPGAAVFAMERVLQHQPDNPRARLELARGYYLLEQYQPARREFERVLAADPPEQVRDNVQRYLDRIRLREGRYRTTSSAYIEFGGGFDDNVNSAPDDVRSVTLIPGFAGIDPNSLSVDDGFFDITAGANITHPLKPGLMASAGASAHHQANWDEDDFDRSSLDGNLGIALLQGKNHFNLKLQGQKYWVGGDEYRDLVGVTGEWRYAYNAATMANAFVQGVELDFPANPYRDSRQWLAGIGGLHAYSGKVRPVVFGALYLGKEFAERDAADAEILVDREMVGGRLGVQVTLRPDLSADLVAHYRISDYLKQDPLFRTEREDKYAKLELGATWLFREDWSLRAEVSHVRNDSTIDIHEYDGTRFGLTFRHEF